MTATDRSSFDVAVIGAGVVGCAVVRALTLAGLRVVLLEKSADILEGASKGNSAILHTGFDASPGTLEARLVRRGYDLYQEVSQELDLPFLQLGALVVAWNGREATKLRSMRDRAIENGVDDVRLVEADALYKLAPMMRAGAHSGLHVPGEGIIDPWSAPLAYVLQAMANGAVVHRDAAIIEAKRLTVGGWRLTAVNGRQFDAGIVVNCAGLYGDFVEALA